MTTHPGRRPNIRRLACALIAANWLLLPHPALAEPQSEGRTETSDALEPSGIDARYAAATAALDAGHNAAARELLETIVAERPEFAGAWLDLALATYHSGDPEAAIEHLDYLRSHFALPPALALQINDWYAKWQQGPPTPTPPKDDWHGDITLGVGHDSNVNAGVASNALWLTLSDGNLLLPVDKSSRPQSDSFALVGLTTWGPAHAVGQGNLVPVVLMRAKQQKDQGDYDSLDLQAGAVYRQPAKGDGSWRFAAFLQHYKLGGNTLNDALRLETYRIRSWGGCQLSTGGELEKRKTRDTVEIGGHSFSLSSSLSCPLPDDASVAALLRLGHTRPRDDWPGGPKNGQELALQYSRPLEGNRRAEITWRANRLTDEDGYSPLFENNAARRIFRQNVALTVRQPITVGWDALFSAEYLRQTSNIDLFAYNGRLFMFSLTHRF